MDLRPQMAVAPVHNNGVIGNVNGNGNYLTFDMYPELGRRRAETVTGATDVVGDATQRAHHHHTHFHVHARMHGPPPMRFVPTPHARPVDSGPSPTTRRRRGDNSAVGGGFRLPLEDHDMVLG